MTKNPLTRATNHDSIVTIFRAMLQPCQRGVAAIMHDIKPVDYHSDTFSYGDFRVRLQSPMQPCFKDLAIYIRIHRQLGGRRRFPLLQSPYRSLTGGSCTFQLHSRSTQLTGTSQSRRAIRYVLIFATDG